LASGTGFAIVLCLWQNTRQAHANETGVESVTHPLFPRIPLLNIYNCQSKKLTISPHHHHHNHQPSFLPPSMRCRSSSHPYSGILIHTSVNMPSQPIAALPYVKQSCVTLTCVGKFSLIIAVNQSTP